MRRHHRLLSQICPVLAALTSSAMAGQLLVQSGGKAIASDSGNTYILRKYSEPLSDPMATAVRNIMLFNVLAKVCRDVKVDRAAADLYIERSGFSTLPREAARDAARLGAAQLDYLDHDDVTHLCAGSDYLFGPHGVLIEGAMSKGSGKPAIRYDPKNPYLKVPSLDPRLE